MRRHHLAADEFTNAIARSRAAQPGAEPVARTPPGDGGATTVLPNQEI